MLEYGITSEQLEKISDIFKDFKKISTVSLIGSRAKGIFRSGSDIDLLLRGENILLDDLSEIMLRLDDLFLPYKFDLIIFSNVKDPELLSHIFKYAKIIYPQQA